MLLNLIVTVLILLTTAYLANQGMLSSLLALATSIFSSILAMALLEPLQGLIGGWRPDYARGVTFLLLFFLTFTITRIAADIAVPKNIKLSTLYNRVAGGTIGFFTALVVVGTLLIGFEMLPINRTPMGFDRFPDVTGMQALDSDGKLIPGQTAKPGNVWFAPDRFVLAIWDGASGRALGGDHSWASIHPDLTIESYGYRNHVDGSRRALPADLLIVKSAAWLAPETKYKSEEGVDLPSPGKRLVMVRTEVRKGDQPPHDSGDSDSFLRTTASQARLVTDKFRQCYPIGYLEQGRSFIPLALADGYVLDDYTKAATTVQDWIFQVAEDEKPVSIEVKQLARADLKGLVQDKQSSPLALAEYPAHAYLQDMCTLSVELDPTKTRELKSAHVYVLKPDAVRGDISGSILRNANDHVQACLQDMTNNANGWSPSGKPGVPARGPFSNADHFATNFMNGKDEEGVPWTNLIPMVLLGQITPDGARNLAATPLYFNSTVVPLLRNSRGSLIVASAGADLKSGLVTLPKIMAGSHPVVVTMLVSRDGIDRAYYVWVTEVKLGEQQIDRNGKPVVDKNNKPVRTNQSQKLTFTAGVANPAFQLDLDEITP